MTDINLKRTCGLDLKLDPAKPEIISAEALNFPQPAVRRISEMRQVLLDKNIAGPQDLYYMYRDVYLIADKPLLEKNKLRYDLTVIKPDKLGRELMKTAGHYHPDSFTELYEVVHGRCLCLLQRPNAGDHRIIEEVIIAKAQAGEKIVIPPGFGHILINPGPDYLVTSNWVSSEFASEYDLYQKAGGAAYFVVGSYAKLEFIPNAYFRKLAKIKFVQPAKIIDQFGLEENKPIYPVIHRDAEKFNFLNRPLDFRYDDVFITVAAH